VDESGRTIQPDEPNGYKFETFIFDALRFTRHPPVALEIERNREFTPVKQLVGDDSVESATRMMTAEWASWLEAAGHPIARDAHGDPLEPLEISPKFAADKAEFLSRHGVSKEVSVDPRQGVHS